MKRTPCSVFDRLTGRAAPALTHPTADSFDPVEFVSSLDPDNFTLEDCELVVAAIFFGRQIRSLREQILPRVGKGLDHTSLLRLAIGSTNRTILLSRQKLKTGLRAGARSSEAGHVSAILKQLIPTPEGGMSADDIATTVVDALPHWFALIGKSSFAGSAKAGPSSTMQHVHAFAEQAVTLERSLRDLWQQVLWEPWRLGDGALYPRSRADAALWAAWQHREDARTHQLQQFDIAIGETHADKPWVLAGVVKEATLKPNGHVKLRFGREAGNTHTLLYQLHEVLENSYLAAFLSTQLPGLNVTVRQACHGWFGLITLSQALTRSVTNWEFDSPTDLVRLSLQMPRRLLVDAIARTAGLDPASADRLAETFTVDPADLASAFRHGAWHRPIVKLSGSEDVLFTAGTLQTANVIYFLERLLHATGLAKQIERGSLGRTYEAHLCRALASALDDNPLLRSTSQVGLPIPKRGSDGEEIDLVVRVGDLVLVGEIKCFVRPTDPIDRHDYIVKLESAACQAVRKRDWLSANLSALETSLGFGAPLSTGIRMVPIVVVNNSVGSGLDLGGAIVTDAHWFKLLLGSGSYASSVQRDNALRQVTHTTTELYSSSADLQGRIQQLLLKPYALQKFLRAIEWTTYELPLEDGSTLSIERPILSNALMVQAETCPSSNNLRQRGGFLTEDSAHLVLVFKQRVWRAASVVVRRCAV